MKKLFVFISVLFFFTCVVMSAQNYEEVVYLHNGSVIRGLIIEQVPNETIKIETKDGNLFVYNFSEIEKITKEFPKRNSSFNKRKGYFGHVEVSVPTVLLGLNTGVNIINGYRVCPQFAVGFGTGINADLWEEDVNIPLFIHLRSDFLNKPVSPYLAVDLGARVSFDGYVYMFIAPQIGVSYNVGKYRMTTGIDCQISEFFGVNFKVGFSF